MSWMSATGEGVAITVRVAPRASKTGFAGAEADWLRIRLQAPPVDGKANAALLAFLAKRLGIPKSAVQLISGETARVKRILLRGVAPEAVSKAIGAEQ